MTGRGSNGGVDYRALDLAEGISVEPLTQWKLFRTRFVRHRLAMASAVVLGLIVGSALFADLLPLADPIKGLEDSTGRLANLLAPRAEFWFGTDELGRDLLSRVVYGGRTSLTVAALTG